MDALYFRVSTDRQTTENQFEDLLQVAVKDGSARNWPIIRDRLSQCIQEERLASGRLAYRVRPEVVAQLTRDCVFVEQGRSGKAGVKKRPLFEQMKRDAGLRKFDRLLVWKVSRLGRDMREVISTVYELSDLDITVDPIKSQTARSILPWADCCGQSRRGLPKWKMAKDRRRFALAWPEPEQQESVSADPKRILTMPRLSGSVRKGIAGERSPANWESVQVQHEGPIKLSLVRLSLSRITALPISFLRALRTPKLLD